MPFPGPFFQVFVPKLATLLRDIRESGLGMRLGSSNTYIQPKGNGYTNQHKIFSMLGKGRN